MGWEYGISDASPIRVHWERRLNCDGDKNSVTELDFNEDDEHYASSTIFPLIGDDLRSWKDRITDDAEQHADKKTLRLPGGIAIISGGVETNKASGERDKWYVEVSLDDSVITTLGEQSTANTTAPSSSTVRRNFDGF